VEESIDPTGEEGEPAPVFWSNEDTDGSFIPLLFKESELPSPFESELGSVFGLLEGTEFGGIRARFPQKLSSLDLSLLSL